MTVEEMISDQDKFAQQVRDRCSQEMESFGLVIDSFQIQEITSPSNYIENLAVPHQAEVEQNARIARANADREAVGAGADGRRRRSPRRSATRRSRRPASRPRSTGPTRTPPSRARSPRPPRARRSSRRRRKVAELQAEQKEQQLQVDVRKPADAEAYRRPRSPRPPATSRIRQAEAEAQEVRLPSAEAAGRPATKIQAEAQADATRAQRPGRGGRDPRPGHGRGGRHPGAHGGRGGRHRAARRGARARTRKRSSRSRSPRTCRRSSGPPPRPFEHVGNFTVLNGAEGVTGALAEIIQQAGALSGMARNAPSPLARPSTNGSSPNGNGHAGPKPVAAATGAPGIARRRPASASSPSADHPKLDAEPSGEQ